MPVARSRLQVHVRSAFVSRLPPRAGAERYLLLMFVTFGLTVTLVRIFLLSTGYPQLGGGTYHVAHALWGGLLLVLAAILPLLYSGRQILRLSAISSGVGSGLFIDEVGKFICFFPLAGVIIFVLAVVNVLNFYFNIYGIMLEALIQLTLLLLLERYRPLVMHGRAENRSSDPRIPCLSERTKSTSSYHRH